MTKNFIEINTKVIININDTLKKTYMLLAATILFSAFTTLISVFFVTNNSLLLFILSIALLFFIKKNEDNYIGLILVFAYAGLMGFIAGPLINNVLKIKNCEFIIMYSLLTTSIVFISLSLYTIVSKKNFNFLKGFALTGFVIILVMIIANIFIKINILTLMISSFIILISSLYIMITTSNIIHEKEINYISATISLYLDVYNIFYSLISILTLLSTNKD